jgi:hypothetical protein
VFLAFFVVVSRNIGVGNDVEFLGFVVVL